MVFIFYNCHVTVFIFAPLSRRNLMYLICENEITVKNKVLKKKSEGRTPFNDTLYISHSILFLFYPTTKIIPKKNFFQ